MTTALRKMVYITHITSTSATRPAAAAHVRRLSAGGPPPAAASGGPSVGQRCRCWPNPPCHHHTAGSCAYGQFECGGHGGGGGLNNSSSSTAAAAAASIVTRTHAAGAQMLMGATQAFQAALFDSERAAAKAEEGLCAGAEFSR